MSFRDEVRRAIWEKDHAGFYENYGKFYNVRGGEIDLIAKVFMYWNEEEAYKEYENLEWMHESRKHIRYPRPFELVNIGTFGELGEIGLSLVDIPEPEDAEREIYGVVMEQLHGRPLSGLIETNDHERYIPALKNAFREFKERKIWRSDMKLDDIIGLDKGNEVAFVDAHYLESPYLDIDGHYANTEIDNRILEFSRKLGLKKSILAEPRSTFSELHRMFSQHR